uniref:Translationally-controlled tumor protein homolog 2 (Fragments) n=1 Tax=Pseudotsuga menziesii TaxID=3357 RepID=TCTP2_PSEMZ|nr:RecName: Full=Translationally-controlled tumor protein homolog 2; Short=TCTP2 [Pseudotsuga menziesii]
VVDIVDTFRNNIQGATK